jgi:hypothetical protein
VSFFEYQRMSVFRAMSFPYLLPMARTIRVGEVYLGIDKIGHFFGFGRRYFERYTRYRAHGMGEEEALGKTVRWGIAQESTMVGGLVDGIFSHGDLEANYQGFLMARDLCGGTEPRIERVDGKWRLVRPIDIAQYITPGFDESYNLSHYWGARKRHVIERLRAEYCDKRSLPQVQARFARYRQWTPSFSQQYIEAYFDKKGKNPQKLQSMELICGDAQSPCASCAEDGI